MVASEKDGTEGIFARRFVVVWLVTALGIATSIWAFHLVAEHQQHTAQLAFEETASSRLLAVERKISATLEVVHSITGFYAGSAHVNRDEFRAFTARPLKRHSGIQALEWIPRVPAALRKEYEDTAQRDGFIGFRFQERSPEGRMVPASQRPEYFPVYYVEPLVGNEKVVGFDLASNPARKAALEKSRDDGEPVATARITLIQEKGTQFGFLVFVPFFSQSLPAETVEHRRESLLGFALGVFGIGDLVAQALAGEEEKTSAWNGGVNLYLFDESADTDSQLLHLQASRIHGGSAPDLGLPDARKGFHLSHQFNVGGRKWLLVARPAKPFPSGTSSPLAVITLVTGLSLTLLLAAYLLSALNRTRIVESLVKARTAELAQRSRDLQRSEARARAIVDNTVDGIITIDQAGTIQSFNPAAERIFGYTADEVIGGNVNVLMPEPYHSHHDAYLLRYLVTGDARIIGTGREVEGRRKTGACFPMDLAVSEVKIDEQRAFVGVIRDITERKEVERMKNEFVSTVSHELRTPLTSIMGSLGLIKGGATGDLPEKAAHMIEIAHANSDRLVRLINDILDIEKIESGRTEFRSKPVDMAEVVRDAVEANRGFADQHGVTFAVTGIKTNLMVKGDQDRLLQVVTNLLSNAAKFSPKGGQVEISAVLESQNVHVSVKDHGAGIPKAFHDQIFSRFSQADSSDTRTKGGTGLGLSICKAIVEHHEGEIWFDSTEGVGTTFHFMIPFHSSTTVVRDRPTPSADGKRILVCEDEPDIVTLLSMILEQGGFSVDVARTAGEARDMLQGGEYAAMTLDIGLPDENGIALLREIRSEGALRDLPVVVVSAKSAEDNGFVNGNAVEVVDWLTKPIDAERLLADLRRALRSTAQKPRILHVEDEADVTQVVAGIVGDLGTIIPASDLREARRLLEAEHFDLVILDLILPDGAGEDLLPLLHRLDRPATPVIVFSAREPSTDMAEAISASLVKTRTTNDTLLEAIRTLIQTPDGNSPREDA